jgi:hypothetical protein
MFVGNVYFIIGGDCEEGTGVGVDFSEGGGYGVYIA